MSVQGVFARERRVLHQGFLSCSECAKVSVQGWGQFCNLRVRAHGCVSVQGMFAHGCDVLHQGFCAVSCERARGSCPWTGVGGFCTLGLSASGGVHECARLLACGCGGLHQGFCPVSCECARGACARMGVLHTCV